MFISFLRGDRIRKIFPMDETGLTLDDCNTEGDYYYTDGVVEIPDDWRKKPVKQWPKKIMAAIGISWNVMPRPYVVDGNAKVTAQYFIDNVLSKKIEEDLPRLHGKNPQKISVHFDNAKSYVAKLTQEWMEKNHPNYIPDYVWMANSPDLAPLDYAINGILKKILGGRKVTTIAGLSKILEGVCENFDLGVIHKSLMSWEGRVKRCWIERGIMWR